MSHQKSQIPRLKPASSCGNLTKIGPNVNPSSKSTHDSSHVPNQTDTTLDRKSMIDAPIPVTHRRMFSHHQITRPPWAVDDSLNPFSKDMDYGKPKPRRNGRDVQTPITREMMFGRVDSPPLSIDYTIDDGNPQSYYDNESAYREDMKPFNSSKSTCIQTDGFHPENNTDKSSNKSAVKNTPSNHDKKNVVPLKELKKNNQKSHLPYKISPKSTGEKDAVDFDEMFDKDEESQYHTEEEIQSRINYWLSKRIDLQNSVRSFENRKQSPDSEKHMFRNEITFTPRNARSQGAPNRLVTIPSSNPPSPQTIEAIIIPSDSESERDYIVSSRSLESRSPRLRNQFKMQANLSSKRQSPNSNEILWKNSANEIETCNACGSNIFPGTQINSDGISYHRECFICFWCKMKLNSETFKIHTGRLCCPIHYCLLEN